MKFALFPPPNRDPNKPPDGSSFALTNSSVINGDFIKGSPNTLIFSSSSGKYLL
jgi:hypothetical protein